MADRNRELIPDNWSLVGERALTTGHSGVCRRACCVFVLINSVLWSFYVFGSCLCLVFVPFNWKYMTVLSQCLLTGKYITVLCRYLLIGKHVTASVSLWPEIHDCPLSMSFDRKYMTVLTQCLLTAKYLTVLCRCLSTESTWLSSVNAF